MQKIVKATGNSNVQLKVCGGHHCVTPHAIVAQVCDVSSLEQVRTLAADYNASGSPLHVLVLNAGFLVRHSFTDAIHHPMPGV